LAIFQTLSPLIDAVQQQLQESVKTDFPASLKEPIFYFLEAPGKKIRPLLTLLSCRAVGGELVQAMPAALGVELFHDFTLIHDDIMDQDDLRRGRFTVHKKWGQDAAILVGDLLIGLAYEKMLQSEKRHLPRVLNLFNEALIKVCEGQALDKEFESRSQVSLAEYLDMINKKTAWLFKLSCQLGAILGGASPAEITTMENFGNSLGIGFQIQDDWLDYAGEEDTLGKKVGSDLKLDKKTYVTLKYQEVLAESRETTKKYPPRLSDYHSLFELREVLFELGIADQIQNLIDYYIQDALDSLEKVQPLTDSNQLFQLVTALRHRQS
jgi:geranylgeranyl diphosphate synthase, type II